MKLSIVIPCTDTKGASISLESLMLHHTNAMKLSEILVVGPRVINEWLAEYLNLFPHCHFLNFDIEPTAGRLINAAISMASHQYVLCVQPDCLLEQGVIDRLINFYNFNYDSRNLFQGPLVQGDKALLHLKPWQSYSSFEDVTDAVKRGTPFEIKAQDLGVFSCRRDAWPGVNGLFRFFDGSGYIHDKFRLRGSACMCLPWLKWTRPPVISLFSTDDQIHDFALWFTEMGHDPRQMLDQINAEYHEAVPVVRWAHSQNKIAPMQHPVVASGYEHLISCVLVAGDASDYALNECVESFRRQTYPRRELVIVNDKENRSIDIEMPLVKVVDIPDFRPETIFTITGGSIICMWPSDRIPYPTKLSVMYSHLVDGCAWSDQCLDLGQRKRLVSPALMLNRSILASAMADLVTFDDVISRFAKPKSRINMVQDLMGDTTYLQEKGKKFYRLVPAWSNPKYRKIVTSYGSTYPKPKFIVVFLLMYNLLEWPRAIINRLKELQYITLRHLTSRTMKHAHVGTDKNLHIVLVDQGSTYRPLLDFYDTCDLDLRKLPYPVFRSEFIKSDTVREFCRDGDFFIVLDHDIDISGLPDDTVAMMMRTICDYGGPAVGLRIESAEQRCDCEIVGRPRYWDKPGSDALSPFTMYRMETKFRGVPQQLVAGNYAVRHLPWEIDVANGLSEELLYYARQRLLFNRSADPGLIDAYLDLVDKSGDDS